MGFTLVFSSSESDKKTCLQIKHCPLVKTHKTQERNKIQRYREKENKDILLTSCKQFNNVIWKHSFFTHRFIMGFGVSDTLNTFNILSLRWSWCYPLGPLSPTFFPFTNNPITNSFQLRSKTNILLIPKLSKVFQYYKYMYMSTISIKSLML